VTSDLSPPALARLYAEVERTLSRTGSTDEVFRVLTDTAVTQVPGAELAGITRARKGRFETVAETAETVQLVDQLQYELGSGPCVDAIVQDAVLRAPDLTADARWPEFGRKAVEMTGVVSMLSLRLSVEDGNVVAGLNMYSTKVGAFDEIAESVATLLATHGALALAKAAAQEQVRNLRRALDTSREIGIAMGVLMSQHKITRDQGFDMLRIASQHANRRLAEIASEVADTGQLTLPRPVTDER
jgi:GAF domain-containing protein